MLAALSWRWMMFYGRLECSEGCCTTCWSRLHTFMGQVNSFYRCGLEKEWQAIVLMWKMFKTPWTHLNCSVNAKLALKGSTKRIWFAGPVRPVVQIHTCTFHRHNNKNNLMRQKEMFLYFFFNKIFPYQKIVSFIRV